ncbi:MAG: DEAD/DEAH box helicase [Verrucomicrobiota bacterium]
MEKLEIQLKIPDLWQQEAIRHLKDGCDVIVDAPTGAGKTYVFELFVEDGLSGQAIYTVPTRALANDKYQEWKAAGMNVGIMTGDLAENIDAPVIVATLETQRDRLIHGDGPALLVIDEYQMIGDRNRGVNYEVAIAITPPTTQLLLFSGSVGNPKKVVRWFQKIDRDARLVSTKHRPIPQDEVFFDALPDLAPRNIRGFWPRRIAKAIASDLAPILIFCPHRKAAEDLAKDLANQLPEAAPLVLTSEQKHLAGPELTRMLKNRIAFHHSGLSYHQRAGLIEPLAKNGQLQVVVATNGLGAGINFCMRSVTITTREYRVGEKSVNLRPDELLQMFGRAGRRGMDDRGYVLTTSGKPRLTEAVPLHLRRRNQVDWAVFLHLMARAREKGIKPYKETQRVTERLFSDQRIPLGLVEFIANHKHAHPDEGSEMAEAEAAESHLERRSVIEMLNTKGTWERRRAPIKARLKETRFLDKDQWIPALQSSKTLSGINIGMPTKIRKGKHPVYGRILPVAQVSYDQGPQALVLHAKFRKTLSSYFSKTRNRTIHPPKRWELNAFEKEILPIMPALTNGGRAISYDEKNGVLYVTLDYSEAYIFAWKDAAGVLLINPTMRKRIHASLDELRLPKKSPDSGRASRKTRSGENEEIRSNLSPAEIWFRLKLIDNQARPTIRGTIASFFQHGEGLAIAAALEDPAFTYEDLIYEIANIRAGHRFDALANTSDRMRFACREAFRSATYEGYLNKGLPIEYGDGAAEVMRELTANAQGKSTTFSEILSPGDIERAHLEWRSMLFHIAHAPEFEWDRWTGFQNAVDAFIAEHLSSAKREEPPPLTAAQCVRAFDNDSGLF